MSTSATLRSREEHGAAQAGRALIELTGVSRRYEVGGGIVTALENVDVTIAAGEFLVVLGPRAAGRRRC